MTILNHNISFFDPKTASDEIWDQFFDFIEKYYKEVFPDDPLSPRESKKKRMKDPDPYYEENRWLITLDDVTKVIGLGYLGFTAEISPDYELNKHIARVGVVIDKEYRYKGIGTEVLETLVVKARERGKTVIQGNTILESGITFCKKLSGTVALESHQNRLQMAEVDWDMISQWIDEGPKKAEGAVLERFNDVPERDIEEYCRLFTEVAGQMPWGELEDRFRITPERWRVYEKKNKDNGGIWTTIISREKDGTISGLTNTIYNPNDRSTFLQQTMTGVKEEFRGRGLGKWLKAEMLTYVHDKFPGVKVVITDNATVNAPMLTINRKMGFKEYITGMSYKFSVDELAEKLGI